MAEVLVVTGEKCTLTALDKNQMGNIFLVKNSSLPDGIDVSPVDQPGASPLRDEFYAKVANHPAANATAPCVKLSFTGRGMSPRESTSSLESFKSAQVFFAHKNYSGKFYLG
jgi:hypothetical protein